MSDEQTGYTSGLIPCPIPAGDYRYAAPAPGAPADWSRSISLGVPRVEDQGQLQSCTGHAGTSGAELLDPAVPQLSRRWLWQMAVKESGLPFGGGAYLHKMCEVLVRGVPSEADAPYDPYGGELNYLDTLRRYDTVQGHQLLTGDVAEATWHALSQGYPVVIGVAANANAFFSAWNQGRLVRGDGPINLYHAMLVSVYDAAKGFPIVNSWGAGALGNGTAWCSVDEYRRLVYEARALTPEKVTPLPKPEPTSERAARIDEVQRAIAADYADWLDLDTQSQQRGDTTSPDYDQAASDLLAYKRDGVGNAWRRGQDRLAELVRDGA